MPTFGGVTGRVYDKAWCVPASRAAAVVFLHGFGGHSGCVPKAGAQCGSSARWDVRAVGKGGPTATAGILWEPGGVIPRATRP